MNEDGDQRRNLIRHIRYFFHLSISIGYINHCLRVERVTKWLFEWVMFDSEVSLMSTQGLLVFESFQEITSITLWVFTFEKKRCTYDAASSEWDYCAQELKHVKWRPIALIRYRASYEFFFDHRAHEFFFPYSEIAGRTVRKYRVAFFFYLFSYTLG